MPGDKIFEAQAELANRITALHVHRRFVEGDNDMRAQLIGNHLLSSGLVAEERPGNYPGPTFRERVRQAFDESLSRAGVEPDVAETCVRAIHHHAIHRRVAALSSPEATNTPGVYHDKVQKGTFLDKRGFVEGIIGDEGVKMTHALHGRTGGARPFRFPRPGSSPGRRMHSRPKSPINHI